MGWRVYKRSQASDAPARANHDVNMDVGETVYVDHWQEDNTCSINYRGAHWDASLQAGQVAETGAHVIAEVIGSRLILKKTHTH